MQFRSNLIVECDCGIFTILLQHSKKNINDDKRSSSTNTCTEVKEINSFVTYSGMSGAIAGLGGPTRTKGH